MAGPELSVVCRNCGSEVSPYVTECPYCGTRLRKRAPKLEREGDEIRVREGRRERRMRRDAERRMRRIERSERLEDLASRPAATGVLLLASAVMFVVYAASGLDESQLGAVVGSPGGEWWRYLTSSFIYVDAGYLFVCGLALAIFLPPVERRIGPVAAGLLALATGALGMLAAVGLDSALGDDFPVAAGGNAMALGVLAAYLALREPERRAEPEESYDPIAVAVAAVVLLALPPVALELYHGNVHLLIAAAIVLGMRYPAAWSFVLLTKVTPGIGLLWFAARREWRSLALALGATVALSAATFIVAPHFWREWLDSLLSNLTEPQFYSVPPPAVVRLPIAALIVIWGARTDRPWTVAIAATLGLPILWPHGLSVLAAAIPFLRRGDRAALAPEWRRVVQPGQLALALGVFSGGAMLTALLLPAQVRSLMEWASSGLFR